MAILARRSQASSSVALALALAFTSCGCVFEDKCVGAGVSRGADGKCRATGPTPDAGPPMDAGARDGGGPADAGDVDGGAIDVDAGEAERVVEIATGTAHVCARTSRGNVFCRGNNSLGQLATGDIAAHDGPVRVAFDNPVLSLAGSHATACALTALPQVRCWGVNDNLQVGDMTAGSPITTPVTVPGLSSLAALASSFANTCATDTGGPTRCWGRNDVGQLGFDSGGLAVASPGMPVLVDRGGSTGPIEFVAEVAIGDRHMCFRTSSSKVFCVGENAEGQLGHAGPDSGLARQVVELSSASSIAVAGQHSCAVQSGEVYCWGDNRSGQVDPSAAGPSIPTPRLVAGVAGAIQVVTGLDNSCALLMTGGVQCWGLRAHGSVGDGGSIDTGIAPPSPVALISDIRQISASFLWLMCAVSHGGVVSCWGEDGVTLIGSGTTRVFPDMVAAHGSPAEIPMIP